MKERLVAIYARPNIFAKLCVCCEQFVNVPGLFQLFDCIFHKCPQKPVKIPSLPEFAALGDRHLVAAVIEFVLRMALDPVVAKGMDALQPQQLVPKVRVQGGLFVAFHPALGLPTLSPALGKAVDYIFRVAPKLHDARLLHVKC